MIRGTRYIWLFRFMGEEGHGRRPTTEFSFDCQRFDRSMVGSQGEIVDGFSYVQSDTSDISYGGFYFEDLCVNFTLPSYPEIEMMEGGSGTFLNIGCIRTHKV